MLSKKEQDLIEKVVSGGGATGQSMTADATGSVAQAPGNSKKQGDSMSKSQNPAGTGIEETDPESNVKPTGDMSAQNKASIAMKGSAVKEEADTTNEGMFSNLKMKLQKAVDANDKISPFTGNLKTKPYDMKKSGPFAQYSDDDPIAAALKKQVNKNLKKEDFAALFDNVDISEESLSAIADMFEIAVAIKTAEIEEAYAAALDEEVESIHAELTEQVDQYLSFVASEWLTENEVAVESSLKNELTEEFIDGLKNLFAEHYIDVPSDKVDVLESLALKVEELEDRLNEEMGVKIELVNELNRHAMKEAFADVSEGLVLTQVEKFRTIAENLEFTGDVNSYTTKLQTIRENYFSGKKSATSNILTEEFEGDDSSTAPAVHGEMSKYVTAISRTLKK